MGDNPPLSKVEQAPRKGAFVMCMFEEVYNGNTVYSVGISQFMQFIKNGMLYYGVRAPMIGKYVVMASVVGIVKDVPWDVCGLDSYEHLETAFEEIERFFKPQTGLPGLTLEYEVWHIVDDAELWQAWEHDSAKACKDGGQATNYHVYEAGKCVLDCVREVPNMLYAVSVVNEVDEVVSAQWYADADKWADAVSYANVNGNKFMTLEHQTALELGVYVVDDWDMDEGLADGVSVLNAYYSNYRCV